MSNDVVLQGFRVLRILLAFGLGLEIRIRINSDNFTV